MYLGGISNRPLGAPDTCSVLPKDSKNFQKCRFNLTGNKYTMSFLRTSNHGKSYFSGGEKRRPEIRLRSQAHYIIARTQVLGHPPQR